MLLGKRKLESYSDHTYFGWLLTDDDDDDDDHDHDDEIMDLPSVDNHRNGPTIFNTKTLNIHLEQMPHQHCNHGTITFFHPTDFIHISYIRIRFILYIIYTKISLE